MKVNAALDGIFGLHYWTVSLLIGHTTDRHSGSCIVFNMIRLVHSHGSQAHLQPLVSIMDPHLAGMDPQSELFDYFMRACYHAGVRERAGGSSLDFLLHV